ncbi:MAG: alkaline phosphatase [Planctomycetales bacterium]|nr:alkaline phosphatase [Planctomycetales bacterium]
MLCSTNSLAPVAVAQTATDTDDAADIAVDDANDYVRELQKNADETGSAKWGHWGSNKSKYVSWSNHSNRLIPIYTWGIDLTKYSGANSPYRDRNKIEKLYGRVPDNTLNSRAAYLDQTNVYDLQRDAVAAGKKYIILMIFDGMDWHTTRAASIYKSKQVYDSGRGSGLYFQDYEGPNGLVSDYGAFVTSPWNNSNDADVDAQTVITPSNTHYGGYDANIAGYTPWARVKSDDYLLDSYRALPHAVTDSASSATSMNAGIKTYNAAINVDNEGNQVMTIAHELQRDKNFAIGVVTSVPISHATPAATYSHNVSRNDYQDLSRDLVGLPSISHRSEPLPGVDVLLGAGWGETTEKDSKQGNNFVPNSNKYLPESEIESLDYHNGGKYVVAQRTAGKQGRDVLMTAAREAYDQDKRLFGFFGVGGGQLPFQTADGNYNPYKVSYSKADVFENPTLADYAQAALGVLSKNPNGFWLMIEAGDVDWANHSNNLDSAIGAVLSGDDAFRLVTKWIERRKLWNDTAIILCADHGHYFVLDDPKVLTK